jgi:hypothetical protein
VSSILQSTSTKTSHKPYVEQIADYTKGKKRTVSHNNTKGYRPDHWKQAIRPVKDNRPTISGCPERE